MRSLTLRLFVFLLPLLMGWATLEWWMTQAPTSHSVKYENLTRVAAKTDTLILGSSNAYWDIAPAYLSGSAFNLGNVAQTLYYDDHLLTQTLSSLPKLKRVILTFSYVSLYFQLQGSDEEDRQYYYNQEWNIPPPRLRDRLDPRMWSAVVLRSPGFAADSLRTAVAQKMKGGRLEAAPLDPPVDSLGWCPRRPGDPADLEVKAVEQKLFYHHRLMHFSDEAANRASLEHLLSVLAQHNIEVVLVTPPVWHAYAERMKPEYWQHAQTVAEELVAKYRVRYLSFLNTPELTAEDFLDADHLNQQGAVRFTKMLNRALEERSYSRT
jgi:hypothetical protein